MTVLNILLAVLLSGLESRTTEPVDEVRAGIDRWIKQLESPTLAERARAERELEELGPKILPWLPPNELLPGPTSRESVKQLRYKLQKKLARDSARPSFVTLSGEFALPELLAEITRQTENPLRLAKDLPAAVTHPRRWMFEKRTFWDVIQSLSDELDLRAETDPATDSLLLKASSSTTRPEFCHAGVLRADIVDVRHQTVIGDTTRMLTRLQGELAFEPRLRPLFVHFKSGDFTAVDGDGQTIDNWNPSARYELPMAGGSRRTKIHWDFVMSADQAPQTVSLSGKLLVQLAAATEQIRFDQLTTRKEVLRRRGGVSVRLQSAEFNDDSKNRHAATLRVTVSYDAGGPAFESHRTWVYHNAAWLEDDRRRFPLTDFDALQQTDGSVQLEYRFHDLPTTETLKFVYEAPTLLLDVPFEFRFSQLKVPADK